MTNHPMKCALVLAIICGAPCSPGSSAFAQSDSGKPAQASTQVNVRLHLVQKDDSPVIGAEVSVKGDKIERIARSDSNGLAKVDGLPIGSIEIRVRRVGFKQAQFLARVANGDNAFTISIDGASVTLNEIRIIGNRSVVGRLDDFEMRTRRGGASTIITAEQIDKRNPIKLSQMLVGIPGVRITDALGSAVAISTRGRNPTYAKMVDCVLQVMVDGILMPEYTDIDVVVPKAAYGIEVFNGPSSIPVQLKSSRKDSWCGLIAIWTRSG